MVKFSFHNSKLNELARYLGLNLNQVVGFDLPAGYTCPAANLCKAFSNRVTGKITDARGMKYRCYAASAEARSTDARRMHWHNFDLVRGLSAEDTSKLILESLPETAKVVRIHASGDFFSKQYFYGWAAAAFARPDITFFGYTKVLEYVRFANALNLPNFKLVYSHGGLHDAEVVNEPVAFVVNTPADGEKIGVPVACVNHPADDYDYILAGKSFGLALHGTQPRGTAVELPA
jgi:hypothetical protein